MTTSREDFNETWLTEMPMGLGNFDTFDMVEYNIKDLLKHNIKVNNLRNNLKKVDLSQTLYYWYQTSNGEIILGVELDKKPQGLVVRLVGKNPKYVGKQPFTSDLYQFILNDNKTKSLRLFSDNSLSDEGKQIWDRLFNLGLDVSIYDIENPGKTFKTFNSKTEMNQYFKKDDSDFKRYQYVLSSPGEMLAEMRGYFNIRRFRETVPGLL